jgi:hypothetical protein
LTLIDCYNVAVAETASPVENLRLHAGVLFQRARFQVAALGRQRGRQALRYLADKLRLFTQTTADRLMLAAFRAATAHPGAAAFLPSLPSWLAAPRHAIRQAVLDYRPPRLHGRLLLLRCEEPRAFGLPDAAMGWREHVASPDALEVVLIPHSHRELLSADTAPAIAALLEARMTCA